MSGTTTVEETYKTLNDLTETQVAPRMIPWAPRTPTIPNKRFQIAIAQPHFGDGYTVLRLDSQTGQIAVMVDGGKTRGLALLPIRDITDPTEAQTFLSETITEREEQKNKSSSLEGLTLEIIRKARHSSPEELKNAMTRLTPLLTTGPLLSPSLAAILDGDDEEGTTDPEEEDGEPIAASADPEEEAEDEEEGGEVSENNEEEEDLEDDETSSSDDALVPAEL